MLGRQRISGKISIRKCKRKLHERLVKILFPYTHVKRLKNNEGNVYRSPEPVLPFTITVSVLIRKN